MNPALRTATARDLDAIAGLMDRAFEDDPTARWVCPDRDEFLRLHNRLIRLWTEPVLGRDCVQVMTDLSGAAVWFPPDFDLDADVDRLFRKVRHRDRFERFVKVVEACAAYRPDGAYWELELLGVDPDRQGRGTGALLLASGLAVCDLSGLPVYLESSNPRNIPFYKRHGFELLAEVGLPGTPQRIPMLRRPRATADSAAGNRQNDLANML